MSPFSIPITPDYTALLDILHRRGRARRVHHVELLLDPEIEDQLCARFDLLEGLRPDTVDFALHRAVRIARFLGYDYIRVSVENLPWRFNRDAVDDTSAAPRHGGRSYMNEQTGPITNWAEFEAYPWPDPAAVTTIALEWCQKHLPDDMCVFARGLGHYCEHLTWLMGYQTLCLALYDQPDLVDAIAARVREIDQHVLRTMLQFSRVRTVWASDDMGHRSGTLISPGHLRRLILPAHRAAADITHAAGRPYILHSCDNLHAIMDELIDDVKIDAKHSFEDTILPVEQFHARYGRRVAVLGGIDVDFLCRADESAIRRRVREVLAACPRNYCLGSGNSIANYVPLDHYLAMLDEGRRFS